MIKNQFIHDNNVVFKDYKNESFNIAFLKTHPKIPEDYKTFLHSFSSLSNTSDTTWFNSISDFNEKNSDSGFKWNEFEVLSMEVFDGDQDNQNIVEAFWKIHLPIVISFKNGYSFFYNWLL